ncbi:hypothetical protein J2S76_004177 [Ancylobacter vacuolatus]|uniref:Uncharacterized protein n=2 Tax=Ancylobacter vacuolatus TaxID=223389 RepID=A0ABU0DMR2_9HYPH|nr:hypothetical protein [Ancylobacter vacuolatus]MDQ0349726.1 hypothetical protein [Ancylobacter vacuolatus]
MNTPTVMLVTAASKVAADAIGAALGYGPESFNVRLTTDPAANGYDADVLGPFPGVVTHYGAMFSVLEKPDADEWLSISNGFLPATLPGGREWGEGGVISYADALAAVTPAGKLQVWEGSDSVDAYSTFWGIVAGWRDPSDSEKRLYNYPMAIFG